MKILFICAAEGIDYMSDCLFHGLVKDGHDVIDSKYQWYLSNGITLEQKQSLYGRGMTISGNLPDRKDINREDIESRIQSHEFDLIVYGSIWRCNDYLDTVKKCYKPNEVVIIDGEDHFQIKMPEKSCGIYFKRELYTEDCLPISFAIPAEKIADKAIVKKTLFLAKMVPGNSGTDRRYLYDKEEDYYKGYQDALFGLTKKKAGWDCMRHYEIAANQCLPYFADFAKCPKMIMTTWPVDLQLEANNIAKTQDLTQYQKVLSEFMSYTKRNLTTTALAQYVLSKVF